MTEDSFISCSDPLSIYRTEVREKLKCHSLLTHFIINMGSWSLICMCCPLVFVVSAVIVEFLF